MTCGQYLSLDQVILGLGTRLVHTHYYNSNLVSCEYLPAMMVMPGQMTRGQSHSLDLVILGLGRRLVHTHYYNCNLVSCEYLPAMMVMPG